LEMTAAYVSVIVPVFCDQDGIDACLAALRNQTYASDCYEVIVVDNDSDPPIRIDARLSDFARVVVCRNPGAYAARNAGVGSARGEVLAFTDSDCVPDTAWIQAGVTALQRESGCVIGGEVAFSLSTRPTAIERYQYLTGFMQAENIKRLGFTATANLLASRSQIDRIGPFNERLLSGGDREWCWRAARAGFAVKYAPDAIVRTRPRTSLASAIRQARRVAGGRNALRRLGLDHVPPIGLEPHRSAMFTAQWVLTHPELTLWNRTKVFAVAAMLKVVRTLENLRVSVGAGPERR
jgi:glycosyltransferase involved in cell wall biosynthesis